MNTPTQLADVEAEAAVLGAALLSATAVDTALGALRSGDFTAPAHGVVFEAIAAVAAAGDPVDPVTVAAELRSRGTLDRAGGAVGLAVLTEAVPATSNVSHYVGIVAGLAQRRRAIGEAEKTARQAADLSLPLAGAPARVDPIAALRATMYRADGLQTMDFPTRVAYIDGLILEGLTIIGGKPKLGKSWWAMRAALTVATGGVAFGNPGRAVTAAPVLYLALEDGPGRLQSRMSALTGPDETWPSDLTFATTWPRLDAGGVDLLAEFVDTDGFRVIIVDTLGRVRSPRRGKDSYAEDVAALEPLHGLTITRPGLAIVAVHHARKDDGPGDYVDALSGTTGVSGTADHIAVLTRGRGDADAIVHYTSRDAAEHETAFAFRAGLWRELGPAVEVEISKARLAVLEQVRSLGRVTGSDLAIAVGKDPGSTLRMLRGLESEGLVRQDGPRGPWVSTEPGQFGQESQNVIDLIDRIDRDTEDSR